MRGEPNEPYAAPVEWQPEKPRLRPLRLAISWALTAAAVYIAAAIVPGFEIEETGGAFVVAAAIAIVNAVVPPLVAALRLPGTLITGFLLVLLVDAASLMIADDAFPEAVAVASLADALFAALMIPAVSIVIQALTGTNDDDEYQLRVSKRIARRGGRESTDAPGIIFLEVEGLGDPISRGDARRMRTDLARRSRARDRLAERATDRSAPTRASQGGSAGWNEDIPALSGPRRRAAG